MKTWFDLVEVQLDLTPKLSLPRAHTWRSSVENDSIPLIPEAPGSNQEYFHEERVLKGFFSSVNPFTQTKIILLGDPDRKPSDRCRGTIEE